MSVDVTDGSGFAYLPSSGVYSVVNLSGLLPARMKGYQPSLYIDVNLRGTMNILDYAVAAGAKKVIVTQSISDVDYLCGSKEAIPSDTLSRFPLNNDHSVYSITKTAACNLTAHYTARFGFRHYILRFPNIYLYHPNPFYYHDGKETWQGYRLMIHKAMNGEPLQIWGDPGKVRDIVYVKDCCQIIEKAISVEDAESGWYNVGTGAGTTMEEQVRGIVKVFSAPGRESAVSYAPDMPDAVEYIFDVSKTRKNLGYVPQYGYMDYLLDFKAEMEAQRFVRLWGAPVNE